MTKKERNTISSINTFIVEDISKQQRVVNMLNDATQQIMVKHDGFISSIIYTSLDGTRVVGFVEWKNKEAIENMLNDPRMIIHMNDIASIVNVDRSLYQLEFFEEKR
ncbi:hypothetical protein [Candidatus Nitrosocosmicus sp. FF01]|uniref:hypothetical protein n=1 Tax=Candidatus Nitrosocosmicus sp. FF01 TaxID=3397670 RepID=UPI0039E73E96